MAAAAAVWCLNWPQLLTQNYQRGHPSRNGLMKITLWQHQMHLQIEIWTTGVQCTHILRLMRIFDPGKTRVT